MKGDLGATKDAGQSGAHTMTKAEHDRYVEARGRSATDRTMTRRSQTITVPDGAGVFSTGGVSHSAGDRT
jgi:hypothetical protein